MPNSSGPTMADHRQHPPDQIRRGWRQFAGINHSDYTAHIPSSTLHIPAVLRHNGFAGRRHLAQLGLHDLAVRIDRQMIDEDHLFRYHVVRQAAGAMREDVIGGQLRAGPQHDKGLDRLAAHQIRFADHGGRHHLGQFHDTVFNLLAADSNTVALDEIGLAIDDVDETVFVHRGQIARVQHAIDELLRLRPPARPDNRG